MAAKNAKRKHAHATNASSPRKRGSRSAGKSRALDSRLRGNDGGSSLLVELLTEELPPKSLKRLSEAFAQHLTDGLRAAGLLLPEAATAPFATPRRLAVRITHVLDKQPDRTVERRGPAVATALDADGKPTPALSGFARSCGVEVAKLERQAGEKGEHFIFRSKQKGEPLAKHLSAIVEASLEKLPVAKLMRWGAGDAEFVRPVHGLVMLRGKRIVPGVVLGVKSGNVTRGHRFLAPAAVRIGAPERYESTLRQAKVLASFAERTAVIRKALTAEATKSKALVFPPDRWEPSRAADERAEHDRRIGHYVLGGNEEVLNEVAAIVEWPAVYQGAFDPAFLSVPAHALSLSMQKNQKYFALVDNAGALLPRFLVVANLNSGKPRQVVHGNERVLRARLADARFFYEQDKKIRLDERLPRLAQVLYQQKLGSQLERVQRIERIAVGIADQLGFASKRALVVRAALLCKADLVTDMVGEFPELQGVMGSYYARHDGEDADVAVAIESHYRPRFAGDDLPASTTGICVALADKLETLVGIYGVGLVPTGEKDPYGLRRAALGVVRILVEKELALDLPATLTAAAGLFEGKVSDRVASDVYAFMLDRLRSYLRERGFKPDEIEAVLALTPARLDQTVPRLTALQAFRRLPEAAALAAANKRIRNILRQAGDGFANGIDESLLREDAERTLAAEIVAQRAAVAPLLARGDYAQALKRLAQLRAPVDTFFDKVMVMAEDEALKRNRLALLNNLSELFLGAADIARLQD